MTTFKTGYDNWMEYRKLGTHKEVDFHLSDQGPMQMDYREAMGDIRAMALHELRHAQEKGLQYVIFTHGFSTSWPGKTTARSQVRNLMRSSDATPYIIRNNCIQHNSVFVAAIRPAKP